jgi:uncharacterized membrane protein
MDLEGRELERRWQFHPQCRAAGIAEVTETASNATFCGFDRLVLLFPILRSSRARPNWKEPRPGSIFLAQRMAEARRTGGANVGQKSTSLKRGLRLSTQDLAVAGVFGALAIVLAFTPLGLIPVPNPTEAATSLHLPAIVAGILSGPLVGGMVGLVLALSSWYLYNASFMTFAGGNLFLALVAAFLPRILIGILAYYAYRPLRRWPALAAGVAGVVGTLTNTFGVLGLLIWLGTLPPALLVPIFSMNVPIEIALALVVTIPVIAALRAVRRGRIAAAGNG